MGEKSFELESISLDLKKKVLIVNGKECSIEGITDFSLTLEPGGLWKLSAKKDIIMDFYKDCPLPVRVSQEANSL